MSEPIKRAFEKIGARAKIIEDAALRLDVRTDGRGEFFELRVPSRAEIISLDIEPKDRHLLLMTRDGQTKAKFLCGHDERSWFVAAIPESEPVSRVREARHALMPELVRERQLTVRPKLRDRRRNPAYIRQGEWFFVPSPDAQIDERTTLRNEPITRGSGSTAHMVEEAVRVGGVSVYVPQVPWSDRQLAEDNPQLGAGLTDDEHAKFLRDYPKAQAWRWQQMRRDPELYVRGRVTHPDHKTIVLSGWHRVLMNTEPRARARANVIFLD